MYNHFIKRAEQLEDDAKFMREMAEKYKYGEENIKVGCLISDKDTGYIMKVTKLNNGSNDFEAKNIEKSNTPGKGYHFTCSNWRLI